MSGNRILFTDECREFHDVIRRLFFKVFSIQLNLFEDKARHTFYSHTKNKAVYAFFVRVLEVPEGPVRTLSAPTYLERLDDKLLAEYVGGLFDAEGSVSNRQAEVCFYTTSKPLFNVVSRFLKKIRVNYSTYIRTRRARKEFDLHIYGRDDVKAFSKRVQFMHPEKRKRLALILAEREH